MHIYRVQVCITNTNKNDERYVRLHIDQSTGLSHTHMHMHGWKQRHSMDYKIPSVTSTVAYNDDPSVVRIDHIVDNDELVGDV
jgi:hypothetical protein